MMPCDYSYRRVNRIDWKALTKKYTDKGLPDYKARRCAEKYAKNKGWWR